MLTLLLLAAAAAEPAGTATVPVGDLLALHAAAAPDPAATPDAPPVAGVLDQLSMEGRILGDALEVWASARVSVLEGGAWVRVPIVEVGGDLEVSRLPELTNAWLVVEGTTLSLVTKTAGAYDFDLGLSYQAPGGGAAREALIRAHQATASSLRLRYDPEQIALDTTGPARAESDAVLLRARDGVFRVRWRTQEAASAATTLASRPAREPSVERAQVSVVSTLEGTRLTRALYDLRFEGERDFSLTWPEELRLRRIYVNGVPVDAAAAGAELTLPISPARAGGDSGTVEVVLDQTGDGFHLSGELTFEAPLAGWPTREVLLQLHLPEVFNYGWSGGSMQAHAAEALAPYRYDVPTPGKASAWRQELVLGQAPDLRLAYTVDLEGAYFLP